VLELNGLIKDQGIEILVEMAQKGTIDPWNVDIIDVTDKYLATLGGRDLRLSGRALFYAAVLLRLKSDALEEPEEIEDFEDFEEEVKNPRPSLTVLDGLVKRRTSNKQPRTRPITLLELIEELARLEEISRPTGAVDNALRRRTATPVRSIAHEEDLEGDIRSLRSILNEGLEKDGQVTFSGLLGEAKDRPGVYLALIFLDSRGLIRLEQEHFYGEIIIRADKEEEVEKKNLAA
jgi:segregation and condensation protein A